MIRMIPTARPPGAGLVLVTLLFAACGTPTAEPVFTVEPRLSPIPEARLVPPREAPAPIRDTLALRVAPGPRAPDEFDVVNSPGAVRGEEDRRPAAVVHAPIPLPEGGREALESALLRHGFAVLEQSAVARRLVERSDSLGLPPLPEGRSPDLSRVLRAAQSTENPADYLLVVERFSVTSASDRTIPIGDRVETRAHVEANPGLSVGPGEGEIPPEVYASWFEAELSARLLDVGTGSIVWLGSHDLESPDAEPDGFTIRIPTERRVSNLERINAAISARNDSATTLVQTAEGVRAELREVYEEGSLTRTFDTDEEVLEWQEDMRAEADRLERRYRDLVTTLLDLQSTLPPETEEEWAFFYRVGDPALTPDFGPDVGAASTDAPTEAHLRRLTRLVATSLVNTILIS